jgi:hypothetical protein
MQDRKMRIPFIDSQTRVAQANSLLWYDETHREVVTTALDNRGRIVSYPVKCWVKNRRLQVDTDLNIARLPPHEPTANHINENSKFSFVGHE